jgi:hypothetical protein
MHQTPEIVLLGWVDKFPEGGRTHAIVAVVPARKDEMIRLAILRAVGVAGEAA